MRGRVGERGRGVGAIAPSADNLDGIFVTADVLEVGVNLADPGPQRPGAVARPEHAVHLLDGPDGIGDMLERVATGELHVEIDRSFPLAQAAAAHEYVETRKAFGRVIITP